MPTFEYPPRFGRDYRRLSRREKDLFKQAVGLFVSGLREGKLDPRLRVKRVKRTADVWEMSWAEDGRTTFERGPEVKPGEPHIIWRRVGRHSVLDRNS